MLKVKILDKDHFYYGDYLVDLPSILYEIQQWKDGKTAHYVSSSFTTIVSEIEVCWQGLKPNVNKLLLHTHLLRLAKSGVKGTPFNIHGECLA